MVEQNNWEIAEEERRLNEERRRLRSEQNAQHVQRGQHLSHQARVQMQAAHAEVEANRQHKHAIATAGKEFGDELRQSRSDFSISWAQHGRSLQRHFGVEQSQRIRDQRQAVQSERSYSGEMIRRSVADSEAEYARNRNALLDEKRQLVERVKYETADQVTDEAKHYVFMRNNDKAQRMREDAQEWREQKAELEAQYLANANTNKQAAIGVLNSARAIRSEVLADRFDEAARRREERDYNNETHRLQQQERAESNRQMHDATEMSKMLISQTSSRSSLLALK